MLIAALVALATLQEPFKPENSPDNLKQLFTKLHAAVIAGDDKTALVLTNPLIPDESALKKGLRDDVAPAALAQAAEFFAKAIPADDARRAKLFKADPANTEVHVYASTTEDLVKDEKGTPAFEQFPGGAKKLAETVLRPGTTYYEVALVKPGEKSGMKFHLFYWTGDKWAMLGPLWRAIK